MRLEDQTPKTEMPPNDAIHRRRPKCVFKPTKRPKIEVPWKTENQQKLGKSLVGNGPLQRKMKPRVVKTNSTGVAPGIGRRVAEASESESDQ